MMALRVLLFTIEVVCSLLLIGIILIQKAKGGGLGLAFGGGSTDSLFGSRAGNVLTKATVILAIVFMANTVALAILFARTHDATLMDTHREPTPVTAQPDAPAEPDQVPPGTPATPPDTAPPVEAVPATEAPAEIGVPTESLPPPPEE